MSRMAMSTARDPYSTAMSQRAGPVLVASSSSSLSRVVPSSPVLSSEDRSGPDGTNNNEEPVSRTSSNRSQLTSHSSSSTSSSSSLMNFDSTASDNMNNNNNSSSTSASHYNPTTTTTTAVSRRRRAQIQNEEEEEGSQRPHLRGRHGSTSSLRGALSSLSHRGSPRSPRNAVAANALVPRNSPAATLLSNKSLLNEAIAKTRARDAQRVNDSMIYLEGPQIYTCGSCRTHLTSHDDIISKSFHGRHGRAYLFDQCVNLTIGRAEDRMLITGLHSVCDIFCKRCKKLIGWTYQKAYEASQKYKEGKYIIEKINLHLEESHSYDVDIPIGERSDKWRRRSMSWGSEASLLSNGSTSAVVYEYRPSDS